MTKDSLALQRQQRNQRSFHHKTRTGCNSCKRRRIKCDEAKPACLKCQTTKLVCEYHIPQTWLFQPSAKGPAESDLEQRLLAFSYADGIKYITLYSRTSKRFFEALAPQMTHIHPSAKHALLGVAAQYKASLQHVQPEDSAGMASKYRTDALLNYNRAMRELAREVRTEAHALPLELLLSCILLFTAIELWPQKNMSPHVHILHGLNMCKDLPPETVNADDTLGYLRRMLLRLAENVASFNDDYSEKTMQIPDSYLYATWAIPNFFATAQEANESVDKLLKRVARLDTMSEGENIVRRQKWWQVQRRLTSAVASSMQQHERASTPYHDFRSLLLHLRVAEIMLKTNMLNCETIFDVCNEDFEYILSECEELLAFELAPGSERGPASVRSSLGLLPPLFMVATKCRVPALRQRALELLHGSRRRERSWNSCVATMIAQTLIDAEKSVDSWSSPYSTPGNTSRVCLTHVSFDRKGGSITIQYRYSPWDELQQPQTVTRKWKPVIDDNYELVELSHKSMRAYGYTGTILVSPRIDCQCGQTLN